MTLDKMIQKFNEHGIFPTLDRDGNEWVFRLENKSFSEVAKFLRSHNLPGNVTTDAFGFTVVTTGLTHD
jgi:hypothetical protein